MTNYYAVIGNRDHIKYQGEKRPFWEFLDRQPDGFLSSLAYLPTPFGLPNMPMIGDCGAWSYKDKDIPAVGKNLVSPEWVLGEYQKYFKQGDLVVAPDHMLINGLDDIELIARRKFNIESAREFLPIAEEAGFKPMSTVHGMNLEERLINVGRLYEMGYRHFSLGGMAARASQKRMLLESIQAISDKIRSLLPDAWIHVLGLSSPDYFAAFDRMGIDSCDGSSHFKQAFTGGAFFRIEDGRMIKQKSARPGEEITIPSCNCVACSKLRSEGIDTRTYGSNETNMGRAAHNLNMLMRAQLEAIASPKVGKSPCVITLVSCVGEKLDCPAPAKDLYRSPWFLKARHYVELINPTGWFVISAKHGLINRNTVIEPYDLTLNEMNAADCQRWAVMVFGQILEALPNGGTIQFFAGDRYRRYLIPMLQNAGYEVEIPLQGLGIGQQLAWFDAQEVKQLELY